MHGVRSRSTSASARSWASSYVSFFVDGQLKSHHQLPALHLRVGQREGGERLARRSRRGPSMRRNETHKTGGVRLFVNNPGGHTARVGVRARGRRSCRAATWRARSPWSAPTRASAPSARRPRRPARQEARLPQALPPAVSRAHGPPSATPSGSAVTGANDLRPVILGERAGDRPARRWSPPESRLATLPGVSTTPGKAPRRRRGVGVENSRGRRSPAAVDERDDGQRW